MVGNADVLSLTRWLLTRNNALGTPALPKQASFISALIQTQLETQKSGILTQSLPYPTVPAVLFSVAEGPIIYTHYTHNALRAPVGFSNEIEHVEES